MKYFSLFSGIGAFEKALDRLNVPYELVGFSEIDRYAVNSNTQLYKQAGNSIVVAVAKAIIEMLINAAVLHGKGE